MATITISPNVNSSMGFLTPFIILDTCDFCKPFDLFHPDRKCQVKLYVKRVFITEDNVELIPSYLRFIRGVVDSQDLPLNISRETLQNNLFIDKIRSSIVKKVLSSFDILNKMSVSSIEVSKSFHIEITRKKRLDFYQDCRARIQ